MSICSVSTLRTLKPESIDAASLQRADEEAGGDEQQQRHRHLRGDEPLAQPAALAIRRGVRPVQRRRERHARGAQGRQEREEDGAERREQHGEGDHARVELKIERDRHGQARLERREQTDERPPERQAGEAGGEREDQPFDQQLLQDPPPRRSEREARRDLAPPFDRTREQDAGDVAARDQEHEAGQDSEHRDEADERQDRRRRHALRVGDVDAPARHAVVTLRRQVGVHDALQLVARLPRRGAGLEPADRRHPHRVVHRQRRAVARVHVHFHRHRHPEIGADDRGAGEAGLGDADHRVGSVVEADGLAEHVRAGGEAPAPELVAQDDDGMRVGSAVLVGQEEASGGGTRADDLEEVAGHQPGEHALGRLRGAEAHHLGPELMRGEGDEVRVALAHLLEERIAEIVEPLTVRSRAADVDQRGRVGDADARAQQECVGQAEDRGAGRDTHGQRQHRRQREDRAAGEQTKGIADVGAHWRIRLAAGGDCFTQRENSRAIFLDRAAIRRARRDGEPVAEHRFHPQQPSKRTHSSRAR